MKLKANCQKTIEAILYLIGEGDGLKVAPSQYDIVKSLWTADLDHLNRYGRPITFDNYYAMYHGPVPELAYDMLKPSFRWAAIGMDEAPWLSRETGPGARAFSLAGRHADLRVLSRSDQKALSTAFARVIEDGFGKTRIRTHEHPAWKKAWENRGDSKAALIDYALLFDDADPEAAANVAYMSAHA